MTSNRFILSGLEAHLARFESDFAFGNTVRKLFRSAGADPIYAAPTRLGSGTRPGWVLHVRLPPTLEDSFGFTRQFVVYCLNVPDLQSRVITQLKRLIESAEHPVTSDFAMVITCDPLSAEKIRDWATDRTEGITVLAVHRDELEQLLGASDPGQALPSLLEHALAEQNLYDERTPVHGDTFFGRGEDLRELDQIISQGSRHIGLFGLRRIGKTSLLLELIDRLRRRPNVTPLYIDLEMSSAARSAAHVAFRIGSAIAHVLSQRSGMSTAAARREFGIPENWDDIDGNRLVSDLGLKLVAILTEGTLAESRVVLVLDEAEILLPTPEQPADHAIDLLRVLRGVSQETQRLTIVLAGVNATPSESPVLGVEDNPLFGMLALRYLGPLEQAACDDMIRVVGRRMRMRWQPLARTTITDYVGSHPLLARLAASDVANTFLDRPLRPNAEMAKSVLGQFHQRHSDIFSQMVHSLARYYPDELDVLKLVAQRENQFARELVNDNPAILNHLAGYGVVDRETLRISVPAFAAWLRVHQV
jgi:hypothetical protein